VDDRSFRSYHDDQGGVGRELPADEMPAGARASTSPLASANQLTDETRPTEPLASAGASTITDSLDAKPSQAVLVFGNLEIRPEEIQALADGRRVGLTVREFQVLSVLAQREDRVVRRADIYNEVWGGEMKHRDRSVDVFVRKVRNKLARAAPGWTYIHTHFGIGYRFAATQLAEAGAQPAENPSRAAAA
jgi:DNA-binding response OmpR family regulator